MKIARPIRDLYDEQFTLYKRLHTEVAEKLKPLAESHDWFFISRVKTLESYALKLETGRIADPKHLEDFFACTIVVKNLGEIDNAEELLRSIYKISHRRPEEDNLTHKAASSFDFDDLRLYTIQPNSDTGKNLDLDGLVFEIQIKTILQHAWGVATHDLTYKTDNISWARERIAFQVKAMLEHAEIAIAEAVRLADAPAVAKIDKKTGHILKIMDIIGKTWNADSLPIDRKRLSDNVLQLLILCDASPEDLTKIIDTERRRIGLLPAHLSPYAFILQALIQNPVIDFKSKIERRNFRLKIIVHSDMDLPSWIKEGHGKILSL